MMRAAVVTLALATFSVAAAFAQGNWDKTYNVTGKPSLQVDVDDASVRVHSCGGCRTVRVNVDWKGNDPSRWKVTDLQGGNGIHFALRRREDHSFFGGGWHGRSPEVSIDSPGEADLSLHSGNGALQVAGVRGSLDLKTGNGSIATDDTGGPLRVVSGNGSIDVRHADGTLNADTGNGAMNLEGRLASVAAHSGDGGVQVSLLPGSNLNASSSVTTGNGAIALRIPRDLRATVDASTGDGAIRNNLPIQANGGERNAVRGSMNGGGPTLRVHSGDGSISLSAF